MIGNGDFISREAARKLICGFCLECDGSTDVCEYRDIQVNRIPAADVRPVEKARFNLVDGYSITALGYDIKGLECSNCGATFIAQSWIKRFNFCPNCGALMEES